MKKMAICAGTAILVSAAVIQAVRQARAQVTNAVPAAFVVVDSTGKQLGPVIGVQYGGSGNLTTVALPFRGAWLPVDVQRTSFLTSINDLLFLSSDCTGQPYQNADSGPWIEATAFGPAPTLYVESGPHQAITAQSYLASTGMCNELSQSLPDAVPIAPAINLSVFTPPFKVVPSGM
jgi:hypothetical protein